MDFDLPLEVLASAAGDGGGHGGGGFGSFGGFFGDLVGGLAYDYSSAFDNAGVMEDEEQYEYYRNPSSDDIGDFSQALPPEFDGSAFRLSHYLDAEFASQSNSDAGSQYLQHPSQHQLPQQQQQQLQPTQQQQQLQEAFSHEEQVRHRNFMPMRGSGSYLRGEAFNMNGVFQAHPPASEPLQDMMQSMTTQDLTVARIQQSQEEISQLKLLLAERDQRISTLLAEKVEAQGKRENVLPSNGSRAAESLSPSKPVTIKVEPSVATRADHGARLHDLAFGAIELSATRTGPVVLVLDGPPSEVRTRTPSEQRTFPLSVSIEGSLSAALDDAGLPDDGSVSFSLFCELCFAQSPSELARRSRLVAAGKDAPFSLEPVSNGQQILGGTTDFAVTRAGTYTFEELSLSESSAKHGEREFCLRVALLATTGSQPRNAKRRRGSEATPGSSEGIILAEAVSHAFYAFSHRKVLQRRSNVSLRALSKDWGRVSGGDEMHLVGGPFLKGPSLQLAFETAYGAVIVPEEEISFFSDSVLFFKLPPCPLDASQMAPDDQVQAQVTVTNDGRTTSQAAHFVYLPDHSPVVSRV